MPLRLKKFPDNPPVQGYPNAQVLAADVATLTKLYAAKDDKVAKLVLGEACDNLLPTVRKKLSAAQAEIAAKLDLSLKDVKVEVAKLKKNARIMQKAVHYAACSSVESATPLLQNVRDVLRATISLPPSTFTIDAIGSTLIDILDGCFDHGLVYVKNRFIESRYPSIIDYSGRKATESLRADIIALAKNNLSGRDTFYRDLQVLIALDKAKSPNGTAMKSVLFEVQIVSEQLHLAKNGTGSDLSGHDMYKLIRGVMEFAEYDYWRLKHGGTFKLKDAATFYPAIPADHLEKFTDCVTTMWALYRRSSKSFEKHLQTAIEDSAWYAKKVGK